MIIDSPASQNTNIYPDPPWVLNGFAIASLQLVSIEQVRSFVPKTLGILPVFPGKTLAGVYIANYTDGTLCYNELIAFVGLTRNANRIGAWVTHIYVDHPTSIAGGREIWGLPKQMAQFEWELGDRTQVSISQNNQQLCVLKYRQKLPGLMLSIPPILNCFSQSEAALMQFSASVKASYSLLTEAGLQVDMNSPLAPLQLNSSALFLHLDQLNLQVQPPNLVRVQ